MGLVAKCQMLNAGLENPLPNEVGLPGTPRRQYAYKFPLNRKNALFAGSDGGGEYWAILASLIETCKLNGIDPQAYLADILARIANGYPINRVDELLPWTWVKNGQLKGSALILGAEGHQ